MSKRIKKVGKTTSHSNAAMLRKRTPNSKFVLNGTLK